MRELLQTFVEEQRALNSVNLATILYRAAKMDAEEVFSEEILTFLAGSLSKERLDGRQVANALYGLQGLSDDTPGLRGLLRALSDQVDRAADGADALGPQALSSSLYGLQGLSTELPEVRGLLVGLGRWLQHGCPEALTAQGMGMALYGLQGMRLCPELEALLLALLKRLELSPLDGQAVGNALYGLQSLSSDSPVVLRLLNVLASKLKSFDCKMTEQEVSNALYGLQFMDPSLEEVKEILNVLVTSVTRIGGLLPPSRDRRSQRSRHPVNPLEGKLESRLPADFVAVAFPHEAGDHRYLVDVGCDMGGFVRGVARSRPDLRVVGLELRAHAVAYATARAQEQGLQNAAFVQGNANTDLAALLGQLRETGQVETVTINFPDPHLLPEHRDRRVLRGSLVKVLAQLPAETEVLFQSDVPMLVQEARAAFTQHGCFQVTPWQSREDLVDTERQKVVRRSGQIVHKARLSRCASAMPETLEQEVDRLLQEMRA